VKSVDSYQLEGIVIEIQTQTRQEVLEERLARGADVLFQMEQRGELGATYREWFVRWEALLREYEGLEQEALRAA
jgi:hypothetical protein